MGREIKFRGLDSMTGNWVYGNLVMLATGMKYIIPQNFIGNEIPQWLVDRDTVGEFTGLQDKNGCEIYEGDIVATVYDSRTFLGVVVYDLDELDFKATNGKENYGSNFQYLTCCDEVEVIGNIYKNPELLESN